MKRENRPIQKQHERLFLFSACAQMNVGMISLLMIVILLMSSCGAQTGNVVRPTPTAHLLVTPTLIPPPTHTPTPRPTPTPKPSPTPKPTPTPTPSPTPEGTPVLVYFSKQQSTNPSAVYPVERISPTNRTATFSINELIAGPTEAERADGYVSRLSEVIQGSSNCGGSDFIITLNQKGDVEEEGTATVRFCRTLASSGIGMDAAVSAEITTTLKQFTKISKVVILRDDGRCFGDESGLDQCLQ